MATRVVVDPVTRIEGHLRVEAMLDERGVVKDAMSSGTMWRGLEVILKGRDPRDAWAFCERICGVCTTVHALASVRAVENALAIKIPAERGHHPQHHVPDPDGAGSRHPLLPSARARLGGHRFGAEGRSGGNVRAGAEGVSLVADCQHRLFQGSGRNPEEVRGLRPTRHLPERLLGTSRRTNCRRKRT